MLCMVLAAKRLLAPAVMGVPISASPLLPCAGPSVFMPYGSLRFRIWEDVWASDRYKICLELQGLTYVSSSKLQAKVMRNLVLLVILVPNRSRLGYAEFHCVTLQETQGIKEPLNKMMDSIFVSQ